MSQNENSLLLRIKGDSAGAKTAVAETRAAMATLRTSVNSEMNTLRTSVTNANQSTRQLVNGFQALSAGVTVLDGPLGGVASRLRAMGTVASEATQILSATGTAAAGTGAQIAAIAGPIGIAIAATAALAVGSALLTKALFDLAVTAADFRGKMFDLSQQTGVAVETLSALEIVAKTTGGSIDSIAQSLVIFQGKLEEAQDSGSKAGKIFAELGISTNNTEDAFRSALTQIAKMPVGFEQTNTAAELFGRRGGKQMLAILKEMGGDLDGAITKFRALGLIISEEDARAADEFNDQLAIMQFQFRALLGKEVIPAALIALKDLSKFLKDNKVAVDLVGAAIGGLASVIGEKFTADLQKASNVITVFNLLLKVQTELFERIARATGLIATANFGAATGGAASPFAGLEVGGAGTFNLPGAKSGLFKSALETSKVQAEKELELERSLREDLRLSFERWNSDLEEHYEREKSLVDLHLATLKAQIASERLAVQTGFERGEIDLAEAEKRKADLSLRAKEAQNKRDEQARRLDFEKRRALDKQEIDFRERSFALSETQRKGELDRFKSALDRQGILESELLKKQLEFLKDAHKERIGIIDFELKALSTSTERKKELDQDKAIAEQEYTDEVKRLTRERMDARNLEATQPGGAFPAPTISGELDPGAIGKIIEGQLGPPPEALQGWADLRDIATGALHSMAQGVASLAQQWILYGNVGPGAMRKLVASVLAGVAAQAAILAVMELAYGIAALTPWGAAVYGPAPFHFKSAALFAGIGIGAAAAGRFVASDSFSQKETGATGETGGGRDSTAPPPIKPIDVDRNQRAMAQQVEVRISFAPGFDDVLEAKIVNRYRLGGRLRDTFLTDGQV